MAKKDKVEVQRGPINLDEQYSYKFHREPEMTRRDIEERAMRRSAQTLTVHEPKK